MISKQAIYLNEYRSKAVPEGHKDAKFLLVRAGHEVDEKVLENYDGASSLVNSASKAKPQEAFVPDPPTLKGDADSSAAAPSQKPVKKRGAKKSAK